MNEVVLKTVVVVNNCCDPCPWRWVSLDAKVTEIDME